MTRTAPAPQSSGVTPLTPVLLLVMTVAAGLSVAGNYFAQPLLGVLRSELHLTTTTAGLTVAVAQAGYAAGLWFLVPLGDRFSRRGLAAVLLAATGALLALTGSAAHGAVLLTTTGLAAVTSVGAQVLVPFVAELSTSGRRGRNLGVVMGGVIAGGLVGRAVAGVVADVAGWRTVYWVTAAALLVVAVVVVRVLPRNPAPPAGDPPLLDLMRSTARLLAELPGLRRPVLLASLAMASYVVHLATLTLLLVGPPYGWSAGTIGLVGLAGAVGPLSMPLAGRLVDRGRTPAVLTTGLLLATSAWLVMLPAQGGQVAWLVVGIVLINVGQTAVLNAAQTTCYELRPEARNRINAVFMTLFFVSGAAGGALAPFLWVAGGWTATCVVGAVLAGTGLLVASRPGRGRTGPAPAGRAGRA